MKEEKIKKEAFKKLWLVNKGTPRNKVLKRFKENPDFRAEIEKWETYFCPPCLTQLNRARRHHKNQT